MFLVMSTVQKELPHEPERQRKVINATIYKYILFLAVILLPVTRLSGCQKYAPEKVEVGSIALDKTCISLAKGVETTIIPQITPFAASETLVTWESSNPAVAVVADGKVTAKAYGSTVITAKAGNQAATCSVTVKPAIIGVYYFDGWAGKSSRSYNEPWWPANPPTHLSKRLAKDFGGREPIWGWRDDTQAIMDTQIDLMADNGVDFMLYCWYWQKNKNALDVAAINSDPKHTGLELYLKAKNKKRIQYALLVANHEGAEIIGSANWEAAVRYWAQYFRDPQYVHVEGKPLVVLFGTGDAAITNVDIEKMQETAIKIGFKKGLAIAGCGAPAKSKKFTQSTHYNLTTGYSSGSVEKDFRILINHAKQQWQGTTDQPYIPVINSGWDKRPWEGPDGLNQVEGWYFTCDTPDLFKNFLGDAITWMDNNPTKTTKERLTLIYAWNELGEGGYLVPTKDDPQAAKLKKIGELMKERSN